MSLLFIDVLSLLVSIDGFHLALEWFAAKCKTVGIRISTSKSEHDSQPEKALVEELKYFVLVHKLGRVQKLDRWIGAASALMWVLC